MDNAQAMQWLSKQLETVAANNTPMPSLQFGALATDDDEPETDTQLFVRRKLKEREQEYCTWKSHSVFVGSWNVNGRCDDTVNLSTWLAVNGPPPDFYALGFQELDLSMSGVAMNKSSSSQTEHRWVQLLEATEQFKEISYKQIHRVRLAGILLLVYAKEELEKYINEVLSQTVATGLLNLMGNKGGVGVRISIYHTSIYFICCHLAAGENNLERRNQDYNDITKRMLFESPDGSTYSLSNEDIMVFFFGDLNYRISKLDSLTVREYIKMEKFGTLVGFDELSVQRLQKRVFNEYKEGDINFWPTYKFDTNTDVYDTSEKNRIPSYCDRILWKGQHCEQRLYRSHMNYLFSDHKPISAFFDVGLKCIDHALLKKTYEAIIRSMDLIFNSALPQAVVDQHDVDFGEVRFMATSQAFITLTNTGQAPFQYNFKPHDASGRKFPKWLTVSPETKFVGKDESVTLLLEVYINTDTVADFNSGAASLSEILVLTLQGGKHIFLSTSGTYKPTCFGLPLTLLLTLEAPVSQIPPDQIASMFKKERERKWIGGDASVVQDVRYPFTAPRELYRLIDYITKNALTTPELFQVPGCHAEVQAIRDALDSTTVDEPLPKVSPHSIVEALLLFINSMADPIVPKQFCTICLTAVDEGFEAIIKVLLRLPADYRNIFHYVVSFLKRCLEHSEENGTTPILLASTFGDLIFRDVLASHDKKNLRMNFIRSFLVFDVFTAFSKPSKALSHSSLVSSPLSQPRNTSRSSSQHQIAPAFVSSSLLAAPQLATSSSTPVLTPNQKSPPRKK